MKKINYKNKVLKETLNDAQKKLLNAWANGNLDFSQDANGSQEKTSANQKRKEFINGNGEELNNNETDNIQPFLSDEEYSNSLDDFERSYLSQETIKFIENMYKKYCKNIKLSDDLTIYDDNEEDMDVKKAKCIANIYNKIKNANNNANNKNESKEVFNINFKLFEDGNNKWTENELKLANEYINETKFAKELRKLILGIYNDEKYNELKYLYSNDAEKNISEETDKGKEIEEKRKIIRDELRNNPNNLFNYLTQDDWNALNGTLTMAIQGNTAEEKLNYAENKIRDIIQFVDKCTFDTKIPGKIELFYKTIRSEIMKRTLYGVTCSFKYFGEQKPREFIIDRPKIRYVDTQKNKKSLYKNIPAYKVYASMPEKDFWKNVAYIDCRTKEAMGLITAAIGDLSRRNELNIQQSMISTGLKTNTIIYTLSPSDDSVYNKDKNIIEDRKGGILFKKPLSKIEKEISRNIQRQYFIIVTEGLFRKGEIISKIGNKIGNMIKRNSGSNYDISGLSKIS